MGFFELEADLSCAGVVAPFRLMSSCCYCGHDIVPRKMIDRKIGRSVDFRGGARGNHNMAIIPLCTWLKGHTYY